MCQKDASLISDLYEIENNDKVTDDKYLKEEDLPKIKQIFWGIFYCWFYSHLQKNASK